MRAVVYEIIIGGKRQIGSTGRIDIRMREHKKALETNTHYNRRMQNAYNKYRSFEYRILSYHESREEAYLEEQRLLDRYYGTVGYLMLSSKATAPPVLKGNKNPFSRRDVIKKLVETKKNKDLYKRSEETKAKISAANKGRRQSEVEKVKRESILRGIRKTEEYKSAHRAGCKESQKTRSLEKKLNSTRLFKENNPSYKVQTCEYCKKDITGASAFKRFHGEHCKLKT